MEEENKPKEEQNVNSPTIEEQKQLAERIEKANEEARKILEEQKQLQARMSIGGKSEAGFKQKTPEELQQEKIDNEVKRIKSRFNIGR